MQMNILLNQETVVSTVCQLKNVVDSSSHFPFRAWTDKHTHTVTGVTDTTDHSTSSGATRITHELRS